MAFSYIKGTVATDQIGQVQVLLSKRIADGKILIH